MKKILTVFFAVAAFAAVGTITSCTKTCDKGYEGSDCKTKMNAKFAGTYSVHDTASITLTGSTTPSTSIFTYSLTVAASSSDPTAVSLSNFGGFGAGTVVNGAVNGTALTIPNQTVGNESISNASGSISNNALSFVYTSTDTGSISISHAVGLK